MYFYEYKIDDKGLKEKLGHKSSEIAPEFTRRTARMLTTIENVVKNFIPHGQHCRGKGGTTKSAIRHRLTENGGQVYADENLAPWFKWFHDGRGPVEAKYGGTFHHDKKTGKITHYTPQTYLGKKIGGAGALRFCIHGELIFRRSVKASKPNPVMQKGAQEGFKKIQPQVNDLARWITEL